MRVPDHIHLRPDAIGCGACLPAAFLERGGRWLALHGTNSILRFTDDGRVDVPDERPDVMELLGTQFKAHPPSDHFAWRWWTMPIL